MTTSTPTRVRVPSQVYLLAAVIFGLGALIGVVVGGRFADRNVFGNIVGSLAALAISLFALWLVADNGWAAIVMIVLIGASGFSIAGALNARVFQIAPRHRRWRPV